MFRGFRGLTHLAGSQDKPSPRAHRSARISIVYGPVLVLLLSINVRINLGALPRGDEDPHSFQTPE